MCSARFGALLEEVADVSEDCSLVAKARWVTDLSVVQLDIAIA